MITQYDNNASRKRTRHRRSWMPRVNGGLPLMLCLPFVLASCARFIPAERGREMLALPAQFTLYEESAPPPGRWWESFASPELNTLVEQALAGNLNLQQVYARLQQAEMLAVQAGAARYPTLDASSDLSTTRRRTDPGNPMGALDKASQQLTALERLLNPGPPVAAGATPLEAASTNLDNAVTRLQAADTLFGGTPDPGSVRTIHSYRFGLATGYEVDLWGRVRATHQAALLDYEATREDVYAAMLSLSGSVVTQWLSLAAQRQELRLVEKQIELNRTQLGLMELRYRKGMATALDVYQQRQVVAQTESLVPPLEAAIAAAENELAVLAGLPPRSDMGIATDCLPQIEGLPDPGLPADLLARRPDVRAAGLDLQAADWRVSAAQANRLPTFRLSASASYGSEEWDLLFNNWMATLAGSIVGPIVDGGRRKAEVERTRAVVDQRLAAYRQQVLEAILEVENSLVREEKQVEYIAALKRELEASRAAHKQALMRYRKGLNDYLPVLSALLQLQVLERRLVQAELTRLTRRAQACLALGGTWMADTSFENEL